MLHGSFPNTPVLAYRLIATAVAPMRSRLRDLLERPGTQHTIMTLKDPPTIAYRRWMPNACLWICELGSGH